MIPVIPIPKEARQDLAKEVAAINRVYRTPRLRADAIDHAIQKFKDKFPHAFKDESAHAPRPNL